MPNEIRQRLWPHGVANLWLHQLLHRINRFWQTQMQVDIQRGPRMAVPIADPTILVNTVQAVAIPRIL